MKLDTVLAQKSHTPHLSMLRHGGHSVLPAGSALRRSLHTSVQCQPWNQALTLPRQLHSRPCMVDTELMLIRPWQSAPLELPPMVDLSGYSTDAKCFPFSNFTYYWTLFSKFFSSFPYGTCLLSVSCRYLALDGVYHRLWAAISNNPTLKQRPIPWLYCHEPATGLSPSLVLRSRRFQFWQSSKTCPQITTLRRAYKYELFPVHSPLLRESLLVSFPPLINMLKFSGYSCLIWDLSMYSLSSGDSTMIDTMTISHLHTTLKISDFEVLNAWSIRGMAGYLNPVHHYVHHYPCTDTGQCMYDKFKMILHK